MKRAPVALRLALLPVLLAATGAGTWWWTSLRPERVATAVVREEPLSAGFTATGRVWSTENARVGAKVAGRVVERRVDRGAHVRKGEVLAVLAAAAEDADIAEARADVAEAAARLAELRAGPRPDEIRIAAERLRQAQIDEGLAARTSTRYRRLFEGGFISEQQADEAETRARIAAHEIVRARKALELLREGTRPEILRATEMTLESRRARLQRMEAARDDRVIRSPLTGTVLERYVDPGETVTVGQTMFLVESTDPAQYEIRADVDEALIGRVRVGQRAALVPEGATHPVDGRVAEIAPGVDSTKGTVEIKIRLVHAADGVRLRPSMTVDVTVLTTELAHALVIPRSAVWAEGDARWVVRVRDDRAERVRIRTGLETERRVQVVAGLRAGDEVVTASPERVASGRTVVALDGRR